MEKEGKKKLNKKCSRFIKKSAAVFALGISLMLSGAPFLGGGQAGMVHLSEVMEVQAAVTDSRPIKAATGTDEAEPRITKASEVLGQDPLQPGDVLGVNTDNIQVKGKVGNIYAPLSLDASKGNANIQWYRVKGSQFVSIENANAKTYTVTVADIGCQILAVIYTSAAPTVPSTIEAVPATETGTGITQIQTSATAEVSKMAFTLENLKTVGKVFYGDKDNLSTVDVDNTKQKLEISAGQKFAIEYADSENGQINLGTILYYYGSDDGEKYPFNTLAGGKYGASGNPSLYIRIEASNLFYTSEEYIKLPLKLTVKSGTAFAQSAAAPSNTQTALLDNADPQFGSVLKLSVQDTGVLINGSAVSLPGNSSCNVDVSWYRYKMIADDVDFERIQNDNAISYEVTADDINYHIAAVLTGKGADTITDEALAELFRQPDTIMSYPNRSDCYFVKTSTNPVAKIKMNTERIGVKTGISAKKGTAFLQENAKLKLGSGASANEVAFGTVTTSASASMEIGEEMGLSGKYDFGTPVFYDQRSQDAVIEPTTAGIYENVYVRFQKTDSSIFDDSDEEDTSYIPLYVKLSIQNSHAFVYTGTGDGASSGLKKGSGSAVITELDYGDSLSVTVPADTQIAGEAIAVTGTNQNAQIQWWRYQKDGEGKAVNVQLIPDAVQQTYKVCACDINYYLAAVISPKTEETQADSSAEEIAALLSGEDTRLSKDTNKQAKMAKFIKASTPVAVSKIDLSSGQNVGSSSEAAEAFLKDYFVLQYTEENAVKRDAFKDTALKSPLGIALDQGTELQLSYVDAEAGISAGKVEFYTEDSSVYTKVNLQRTGNYKNLYVLVNTENEADSIFNKSADEDYVRLTYVNLKVFNSNMFVNIANTDTGAVLSSDSPAYGQTLSVAIPNTEIGGKAVVLATDKEQEDTNAHIQWYRYHIIDGDCRDIEPIKDAVTGTYMVDVEDVGYYLAAIVKVHEIQEQDVAVLEDEDVVLAAGNNSTVDLLKVSVKEIVPQITVLSNTTGNGVESGRELLNKLVSLKAGSRTGIAIGTEETQTIVLNMCENERIELISKNGTYTADNAKFYINPKSGIMGRYSAEEILFDTAGIYEDVYVRFSESEESLFAKTNELYTKESYVPLGLNLVIMDPDAFATTGADVKAVLDKGNPVYGERITFSMTNRQDLLAGGNTVVLTGEEGTVNTSMQWYRFRKSALGKVTNLEIIKGAAETSYMADASDVGYYLAAVCKASTAADTDEDLDTIQELLSEQDQTLTKNNNARGKEKMRMCALTTEVVPAITLKADSTGRTNEDGTAETGAQLLGRLATLTLGDQEKIAINKNSDVEMERLTEADGIALASDLDGGTRNLGTQKFYYKNGEEYAEFSTSIAGEYDELYVKLSKKDGNTIFDPADDMIPLGIGVSIIDSKNFVYTGADAGGTQLALDAEQPQYGIPLTVSIPATVKLAGRTVTLPGEAGASTNGVYVQWYRYDSQNGMTRIEGADKAVYSPGLLDINAKLIAVVGTKDHSKDEEVPSDLLEQAGTSEATILKPKSSTQTHELFIQSEKAVEQIELKTGQTGRTLENGGKETMQQLLQNSLVLKYGKKSQALGQNKAVTPALGDILSLQPVGSLAGLGLGTIGFYQKTAGGTMEKIESQLSSFDCAYSEIYIRSEDAEGIFKTAGSSEDYYVPLGVSIKMQGTFSAAAGASSGTLAIYDNAVKLSDGDAAAGYGDVLELQTEYLQWKENGSQKDLLLPGKEEGAEDSLQAVNVQWYRAKLNNDKYTDVELIDDAAAYRYTVSLYDIGYYLISVLYVGEEAPSPESIMEDGIDISVGDAPDRGYPSIAAVTAMSVNRLNLANNKLSEQFVQELAVVSYDGKTYSEGDKIVLKEDDESQLGVSFDKLKKNADGKPIRTLGSGDIYLVNNGTVVKYSDVQAAGLTPGAYAVYLKIPNTNGTIAYSNISSILPNLTSVGVTLVKETGRTDSITYLGTGTGSMDILMKDIKGDVIEKPEYKATLTLSIPEEIQYNGRPAAECIGSGIGVAWYRGTIFSSAEDNFVQIAEDTLSYTVQASDVNAYVAAVIYVKDANAAYSFTEEDKKALFASKTVNETITTANNLADQYLMNMKIHTTAVVEKIDLLDSKYGDPTTVFNEIAYVEYGTGSDVKAYRNVEGQNEIIVDVADVEGLSNPYDKDALKVVPDPDVCGADTSLVAVCYVAQDGNNFVEKDKLTAPSDYAEYKIYIKKTNTRGGIIQATSNEFVDTGVTLKAVWPADTNRFIRRINTDGTDTLQITADRFEVGEEVTVAVPDTILVNGETVILPQEGEEHKANADVQWYRHDTKKSGDDPAEGVEKIEGATYATYQIRPEDADCYLTAVVYTQEASAPTSGEFAELTQDNIGVSRESRTVKEGDPNAVTLMKVTSSSKVSKIDLGKAVMKEIPAQEYIGQEVTPKVQIVLKTPQGDVVLNRDEHYTIAFAGNDALGIATVTATGIGKCTGTLTGSFELVQPDLSKAKIQCEAALSYTGEALEPKVTVTYDERELSENTDYKVSYTANTNAGTAGITVEGSGFYTGSKRAGFTILPVALNVTPLAGQEKEYGQTDPENLAYDISGILAADQGKELLSGALSRESGEDVGQYAITIGSLKINEAVTKNYTLSLSDETVQFTVVPADITNTAEIVKIADQTYTGRRLTPKLTVRMPVSGAVKTLVEGTDYEAEYTNNQEIGAARVTVSGINNFRGTLSKTFRIVNAPKKNIAGADVRSIANRTYTGQEIRPEIVVIDNDLQLVINSDYIVRYENNINVGTAQIELTGIGAYNGTKTVYFQIVGIDISSAVVTPAFTTAQWKQGQDLRQSVTSVVLDGKQLEEGTDYQVLPESLSQITHGGSYTLTVLGKGNYGGTASVTYTVTEVTADSGSANPGSTAGSGNASGAGSGGSGTADSAGETGSAGTGSGGTGTAGSETGSGDGAQEVQQTPVQAKGTKLQDASHAVYVVTSADGSNPTVQYSASNSSAKSVKIPDTIVVEGVAYKVTAIAAGAFDGNKYLQSVTIGKNVETIANNAFRKCKKLKTVKIGNNVVSIGKNAFANCTNLTSITIPNKTKKIMDSCFAGCSKLTTVTIGTGLENLGKTSFSKCSKLKTIRIKSAKLTAKSISAGAFKGIGNKVQIRVPSKKVKEYTTLFRKKGLPKKVKVKK